MSTNYVVQLAAYETERGKTTWIGVGPGLPSVTDCAKAARMPLCEAQECARSLMLVSGGYGWHPVPAHIAEAGYDVVGQGVGAGYKLSLRGALLDGGPYTSRDAAFAAARERT